MQPSAPPRSFIADAVDVAMVEEARAARRLLARVWRAFTIGLALLFVAALFIILFSPGFMRFPCRSMQSEAKGNLKALRISMASFFTEHDRHDDRFEVIGFEPRGGTRRYRMVVTDVQGESYKAWAFGTASMVEGDLWVTDQNDGLQNVLNRCEARR